MGLLLLFFDGIGVGRDEPDENPFAAIDPGWLAPLAGRAPVDGTRFKGLDATLGVPGLPQSATGQTTLLTGVNAARHIGHHQVGTPGPSLRPLLADSLGEDDRAVAELRKAAAGEDLPAGARAVLNRVLSRRASVTAAAAAGFRYTC